MINLHNLVRGAITSIHPDECAILRQSLGQRNIKGTVTPLYSRQINVKAQFQSASSGELYHANYVGESELIRKVYLYAEPSLPPFAMNRPLGRSGDYIYRLDGKTWWLVTGVSDDFTNVGWVCVMAKLQVKTPEFEDN